MILVPREVSRRAGGSKGSGKTKYNTFLSFEQILGSQVLPIKWILGLRIDASASFERNTRDSGTLFYGCRPFGWQGRNKGTVTAAAETAAVEE